MEGFADLAEHFQVLEDSGVLLFHGDFLHESWWLFTIERSRGVNLINDGVDDDDGGGGDDDVVVDDDDGVDYDYYDDVVVDDDDVDDNDDDYDDDDVDDVVVDDDDVVDDDGVDVDVVVVDDDDDVLYTYVHTFTYIYILYYTYVDIGGYITTVILLGHNPVGKPWAQELLAKKLSSKNLRKAMAPCKEECF